MRASDSSPTKKTKKDKKFLNRRKSMEHSVLFMRMIPAFVEHSKKIARQRTSRHQYQNLLFPKSEEQYKGHQSERQGQQQRQQLFEDYQEAKYPHYLTECGLFIEDAHLNILSQGDPLPRQFLGKNLGRAICFGQIETQSSYPIHLGLFNNLLVAATDTHYLVVLDQTNKRRMQLQFNFKQKNHFVNYIKMINHYIFLFTDFQCAVVKYIPDIKQALTSYIQSTLSARQPFSFACPMVRQEKKDGNNLQTIYVFGVKRQNQLSRIIRVQVVSGVFSDLEQVLLVMELKSEINNFRIKYIQEKDKCIMVLTTAEQMQVHYYSITKNAIKYTKTIPYNNGVPQTPKRLVTNKIEFFQQENFHFENGTQERWSLEISDDERSSNQSPRPRRQTQTSSVFHRNSKKDLNEESLFAAVSSLDRIFFLKIALHKEQCTQQKKVRFKGKRIVQILKLSSEAVCFVFFIHDKASFFKGETLKEEQRQFYERKEVRIFQFVVTLVDLILSCKGVVNSAMVDKFSICMALPEAAIPRMIQFHVYQSAPKVRQILVLLKNPSAMVFRISFKTWNQLYLNLLKTEQLKLLKFLILSRNYTSPFLNLPSRSVYESYKLESFFSIREERDRMILLQYYSQTGISPPAQKIDLRKNPRLLIPFILKHEIMNIEPDNLEFFVSYWAEKDERIVEELIVGGAQSGWQLAVKRGWIRALRKMVEMGTQIDLPLLKLYAFILAQEQQFAKNQLISPKKLSKQKMKVENKIEKEQELENENRWLQLLHSSSIYESPTAKTAHYCLQIIQYGKLAFKTFLRPPFESDQLSLFYKALLKAHLFELLIYHQPEECVKLLSYMFLPVQKVCFIDNFNLKEYLHCNRVFDQLLIRRGHSISEMIFSHVSATFLLIADKRSKTKPQKFRPIDDQISSQASRVSLSREEVIETLMIQHVRLFDEGVFDFKAPYKKQMLLFLVKDSNRRLITLLTMQAKSPDHEAISSEQELQYRIQDFLARLWQSIADSLTEKEIKQLIGSIQLLNSQNHFLSIVMMQRLPVKDYCKKILKKFIQSKNKLIQKKIFKWIQTVLPQMPEFEKDIILNLKQLIEIDKQQSRILFGTYFASREKQIISRIDNDPTLQLEYIQLIVQDHIDHFLQLQEYYTDLHIKLLLRIEPQRVIDVLQQTNSAGAIANILTTTSVKYNINEALRLAQQLQTESKQLSQNHRQQLRKILTYLYQKLGQVEKSIGKYLQLLESFVKALIIIDERERNNEQNSFQEDSGEQSNSGSQNQVIMCQDNRKRVSTMAFILGSRGSQQKQIHVRIQCNLQEHFQEMIQLIFRQSLISYAYFYLPLEVTYRMMSFIKQSKYFKRRSYIKILRKQLGNLIVQMFERGYSADFVRWIDGEKVDDQAVETIVHQIVDEGTHNFSMQINTREAGDGVLNQMKRYLLFGYNKLHSHMDLLSNWTIIDNSVLVENIHLAEQILNRGICCKKVCSFCQKQFKDQQSALVQGRDQSQQQEALLFNCGHLYHRGCIEQQDGQDYCWQCVKNDNFRSMIDHGNMKLVDILKKYKLKKQFLMKGKTKKVRKQTKMSEDKINEQLRVQNNRKVVNRFSLFDKRVTTLRTQADIIEMKLTIRQYYQKSRTE